MPNTPHLPDWMLDLLADDALSHAERVQAEAHVKECAACALDLEAARAVIASLDALPYLEPSPGFAEAVMSRVVVPGAAPAAAPARRRRWLPQTRRGWARAGVWAMAPLAPLVVLFGWLLTRPVAARGGVWETGTGWAGERLWSLMVGAADLLARSGAVGWIADTADALAALSATNLGVTLLVIGAAVPVAGWTLLRLFRTPVGGMTHAH